MPFDKALVLNLIREEIYATTYPPEIVAKAIKKAGIDLGENSNNISKQILCFKKLHNF
jgi:hypothetical protein